MSSAALYRDKPGRREKRLLLDTEKGVVGVAYPDEMMPRDEYGNVADILVGMGSPVARTNMGQLYEQGLNFISGFVKKEVERVYEVKGVEPAFETLLDWYNDVNPNYARVCWEEYKTEEDRKNLVKLTIEDYPYLWVPPFHENFCPKEGDMWNAIRNMKKWQKKWNAWPTPITYGLPQGNGEWKMFTSEQPFVIASEYYIHLNKIPKISAPGFARVNHLGIPTKSSSVADMSPVNMNPSRFGEDEHRMAMMDTDVRWVVRLQNLLGNSPFAGTNTLIETLATHPTPSAIQLVPVSNGKMLAENVINKTFHNAMAVLGLDTKNTKIDPATLPEELQQLDARDVDDLDLGDGGLDPFSDKTASEQPKRGGRKKKSSA